MHGPIMRLYEDILSAGAVKVLPPVPRMLFVLHDVEGYEHNEIAEMLGCSIGHSKSQLHKARLKLRSLLSSRQRSSAPIQSLPRQWVSESCVA